MKIKNVYKILKNVLFIISTHGELELKNTNVNNCILENIHIILSLCHITSTLMMAREMPKHVGAINK